MGGCGPTFSLSDLRCHSLMSISGVTPKCHSPVSLSCELDEWDELGELDKSCDINRMDTV